MLEKAKNANHDGKQAKPAKKFAAGFAPGARPGMGQAKPATKFAAGFAPKTAPLSSGLPVVAKRLPLPVLAVRGDLRVFL